MGGLPLPPIGKPSSGGPARSVPGGPFAAPGGGAAGRTPARSAARGGGSSNPPLALLVAVWGMLVLGIAGVTWGVLTWAAQTFVAPLHVGAAVVSFFGSVVVLALLRRDLNRRRTAGRLVERPLTSIRTTTTVALLAWSSGVVHLGLVALELSSGFGG